MARSPVGAAHSNKEKNMPLDADTADVADNDVENGNGKAKRQLGPKVVYIQLREGVPKDAVVSVHTNTRTLVDAMEQAPGSSYTKMTLPQGEPRQKRNG